MMDGCGSVLGQAGALDQETHRTLWFQDKHLVPLKPFSGSKPFRCLSRRHSSLGLDGGRVPSQSPHPPGGEGSSSPDLERR